MVEVSLRQELKEKTELAERYIQTKILQRANEQYDDMIDRIKHAAEQGEWSLKVGGPNLNKAVVAALCVKIREENDVDVKKVSRGTWLISWR